MTADADEVRRQFPACVAFADECRAIFGNGVKLLYVEENGRKLGHMPDEGHAVTLAQMVLGDHEVDPPTQPRKDRWEDRWKENHHQEMLWP